MNTLRQNMIGARACSGDLLAVHQVDDAPRRDPRRGSAASATAGLAVRARNTSPAAPAAARGTRAPGSGRRAPSRSPPGWRRWRGSRSAPRSNQPASSSTIAIVSGSSPLAHGTLQIRSGSAAQRLDELRHDRVDHARASDRSRARSRSPAPTARPSPAATRRRRGLVVLQQVVVVEERLEAALDDQRRQPFGEDVAPRRSSNKSRCARGSDRAAAARPRCSGRGLSTWEPMATGAVHPPAPPSPSVIGVSGQRRQRPADGIHRVGIAGRHGSPACASTRARRCARAPSRPPRAPSGQQGRARADTQRRVRDASCESAPR